MPDAVGGSCTSGNGESERWEEVVAEIGGGRAAARKRWVSWCRGLEPKWEQRPSLCELWKQTTRAESERRW